MRIHELVDIFAEVAASDAFSRYSFVMNSQFFTGQNRYRLRAQLIKTITLRTTASYAMDINMVSASSVDILSFEAVHDVTSSWETIMGSPEHEHEFAEFFFRNILECIFFAKYEGETSEKRSSLSHVDDKNVTNPLFKIKSQMFVQMLSVVMDLLGPDLVPMKEVLVDLGAKHLDYGVMVGDYDVIGDALMMTLAAHLKDQWSAHMEKSWRAVYIFMASAMIEGSQQEEKARKNGKGKRNLMRMSIPPRHRKLQLDNDEIAATLKEEGKGLLGMLDKALTVSTND